MNQTNSSPIPATWQAALERAGFTAAADNFFRNAIRVTATRKSLRFVDTAAVIPSCYLSSCVNEIGLWKWVRDLGQPQRAFDLPWSFGQMDIESECDDFASTDRLDSLLDWVLKTAQGSTSDWQAPNQAHRKELLANVNWTVQRGSFVRQGRCVSERTRLALEYPLLPEVPATLPQNRRLWLDELLRGAQDRWLLIRFGYTSIPNRGQAVIGRVDLSGAPLGSNLISTSLEALQAATSALIESVEWLVDMRVASQALAASPNDPNLGKDSFE